VRHPPEVRIHESPREPAQWAESGLKEIAPRRGGNRAIAAVHCERRVQGKRDNAQGVVAQQNSVTAIDIALEPDATMVQHAMAANALLLKSFPKGFSYDETHHPHVSMLQQFVRTDDLDKVFAAANAALAKAKSATWTLKAFKYYYIPAPPIGLAGIVVETTDDLHRLQDELIKAVEPYTAKTGPPAAFFSDKGGRDIQESLITYVANFVRDAANERFNPHVTIGVGREKYLDKMLAEPFPSFTFSPAGASVYQLGAFGAARKELKALTPGAVSAIIIFSSPRGSLTGSPTRLRNGLRYSAMRRSCLPSFLPSKRRLSVAGAFSRPCCMSTRYFSLPSFTQPARAPIASAARGM
jgi:hypothetical protein